ncbi:MAG: DUF4340 domain-containing protein, partial [Chromatiales bacterium]
MAPRPLVNLALLAVVLGLLALVWLRPGGNGSPDLRVTGLEPADVHAVRIERGPDSSVLLERVAQGWAMRRPYDLPADGQRVARVLQVLRAVSHRRFEPPADRLADYGLERPLVRLEADGVVLELGGTEPIGHLRYVRSGARVDLIDDRYLPALLGRPESFLDHRLLDPEQGITALETADFRVDRGDLGQWRIRPADPAVSADVLTAWVDRWRHAQALEVLPAPDRTDSRHVTITLEGAAEPVVFEVLENEGRRLLVDRRRGLAYRLAPDA